jgi:hypothetical protein
MRGEARFPARAEIVPGELVVRVHLHDLPTVNGREPCWIFVSEGLWALRQKEIVLILKREPGERPEDFPREAFFFYELVYELAAYGSLVSAGGHTDFGEAGLLGRRAAGYIESPALGSVAPQSPSLVAILLTEGEFAAYQAIGLSRIRALLGKAYNHFPCPPWSDRRRPSVITKDALKTSLLARAATLNTSGALASCENGVLTLRLPQGARYRLAAELEPLGNDGTFAILSEIDPSADGCLVWTPGETRHTAISPPGVRPSRFGGCFLAAAPVAGTAADRSQFFEDGFLLSLTAGSYRALRAALRTGAALELPSSPDRFRLEWTGAPPSLAERPRKMPLRAQEGEPTPLASMTRRRGSGRRAAALK